MANPKMVRRADRIVDTDAYTNLPPEEKRRFGREVARANSFEELPDRYKHVIEAGEREMQGY